MHISSHLFETLRLIEGAGLKVWLAGGWGEELRGLIAPRAHNDIDLLYPAENFARVEAFFRACPLAAEIEAKRFSHKRAMQYPGVMVEFLLLRREGREGLVTDFFDGKHRFHWPGDALQAPVMVEGFGPLRIASITALLAYRADYEKADRN